MKLRNRSGWKKDGEVGMIRIDMPMPNSCLECRFRDTVQSGCNASDEPGFCVFVGLSETEIVEWEDWKKNISSGRDPRCPLKQECKGCSTVFDVAYKAGKEDSIIRCKDCIHRGDKKKCIVAFVAEKQEMPYFFYDNRGNWFCADGRRKDDDDGT